jgi:PAS domain S-box-containing protein
MKGWTSMTVEVERLKRELERMTALAGRSGLFAAMLHHSPHGIIVCDASGKLTLQNAAAERIWRGSASASTPAEWAQYLMSDHDGNPFPPNEWPLARSLRGEVIDQIEVRVVRFDGTPGVLLGSTAPIRGVGGNIEGALCVFSDITELRAVTESERDARRRIARLQQMTSALSEARTAVDIAEVVARDVANVLGATRALLAIGDGDHLKLISETGLSTRARRRFPVDAPLPAAHAYRTGRAVWAVTPESLLADFPGVTFDNIVAIVALPVVIGGNTIGSLGYGFSEPQSFLDDDRELYSDLAHQVGLALERARLYDLATRRGREMELLFELAKATAAATSLTELYDRVLAGLTDLLGVERASILLFDHADVMRFVAWRGLSHRYRKAVDGHSPWRPDTPDPVPVFIVDAETDESMAPYRPVFAAEGIRSLAFIPLVHDRRVIGKLMVYGAEPRTFTAEDAQLATTLAATVAQAVVRARSAEAERAAAHRHDLLARASRPLVEAGLDQRALLDQFAAALATAISGAVVVALISDDGLSLVPTGIYHPDPDLRDALVPVKLGDGFSGTVALTGKPALLPTITPADALATVSRNYRTTVERFPVHSALCVPLRTRDRIIGTLTAWRHVPNPFTPDDLRLFEELAERVALAVANARLFARIEESNRSRDEILAVVSHDLRAPLASIVMASSLPPRDPVHLERQFSIIRRNADQMSRLISDLLDFASIQAGRLAIERSWFAADQILVAAGEMFSAAASERGVILLTIPAEPVELLSDRDRVLQALANLVSNAVKVTPEGGRVELSAEPTSRTVIFHVRDQGPGIAPEDQPHVFERYWRGPKSTYRGHGLGLAIAKGIVEALGGHITLVSTPGRGSTFSFSVPR